MPGQLGPTKRVFDCVLSIFVTRTMSCCGMPSVMQTTRGISAATASSIPAAARGGLGQCQKGLIEAEQKIPYGTKIALAFAPVSFIQSATLAKTGLPRCVWPAFLGFVPERVVRSRPE